MAAHGGHQWSWGVEEEFLGWFGRIFEREMREIVFFMLKNAFIIYRFHLASSSR